MILEYQLLCLKFTCKILGKYTHINKITLCWYIFFACILILIFTRNSKIKTNNLKHQLDCVTSVVENGISFCNNETSFASTKTH
jgi:hypothetical protein